MGQKLLKIAKNGQKIDENLEFFGRKFHFLQIRIKPHQVVIKYDKTDILVNF